MPNRTPLTGLVPAVLTPFNTAGELNLAAVEHQAELLHRDGVTAVFVCGTTGEFTSLTVDERRALARRWVDVARGSSLRVVVHIGSNCLAESKALAADAQQAGVAAVATVSPGYFKPRTVEQLVGWCAEVAGAARETPFYFYDIPSMTGVSLPMPQFLEAAADRIPTLAGLKFTNSDLMTFQQLLRFDPSRFDVLWGFDECLLAALALGAKGAVGSTYNFAAPLYWRVISSLAAGDITAAREAQFQSVRLITLMYRYGFLAAGKEALRARGVDTGPVREPNPNMAPAQVAEFRQELAELASAW